MTVTAHINISPTISISTPTEGSIFWEDDGAVEFNAIAQDTEDGDISLNIRWISDLDGDMGTGSTITSTLSVGIHTITATITDSGGLTDNDIITISIEPGLAISTYPYTEGFESGLGDWVNLSDDDIDWTRHSGTTSSSSTGPSSANSGTYYMYTEASSPNFPEKSAVLEGPVFNLGNTTQVELVFWYHMYGASMGTLQVEISEDNQNWFVVWSLTGNQGNVWNKADVDLSDFCGGAVTIRFRGITGTSFTSDMSIDDVTVDVTPAIPCDSDEDCDDGIFCNGTELCISQLCQAGSDPCPGQGCDEDQGGCFEVDCLADTDCDDNNACTTDTCDSYTCVNEYSNKVSTFPYTESFESSLGDWTNPVGDDFNWTRKTGSTSSSNTGPTGAYDGSYYVYTESSSPNYPGKTALLEGPAFDLTDISQAEFVFQYHMYGASMGTLYVEISYDCTDWTPIWSLSGNQGDSWQSAVIDLSAFSGEIITLRFRAVTGTSYTSDISIDDIAINTESVPETLAYTLTLGDNFEIQRTGEIGDPVIWVIERDGEIVLQRSAANELSYTYFFNYLGGVFNAWLISYINGEYQTVSNVVTYTP